MARNAGSGAYLSGIGTMLTQTDVCAACGRVHEDRLFRFRAEPEQECPAVLGGAFPRRAGLGEAETGDFDSTRAATSPVVTARRSGLSIPWIMPTEHEDFL